MHNFDFFFIYNSIIDISFWIIHRKLDTNILNSVYYSEFCITATLYFLTIYSQIYMWYIWVSSYLLSIHRDWLKYENIIYT